MTSMMMRTPRRIQTKKRPSMSPRYVRSLGHQFDFYSMKTIILYRYFIYVHVNPSFFSLFQTESEFDVLSNRAKLPNYNVIFDRKCAILEEVCNQDVSQDLLDGSVMQSDLINGERDCTQERSNKSLAKEEDVSLINVPSNTNESVKKMFNKMESIWESTQSNNHAIRPNHFEGQSRIYTHIYI